MNYFKPELRGNVNRLEAAKVGAFTPLLERKTIF